MELFKKSVYTSENFEGKKKVLKYKKKSAPTTYE